MEGMPKDYVEKGFVVAELCRVAVGLDYADEIGRRKMFQLASESSQANFDRDMTHRSLDD